MATNLLDHLINDCEDPTSYPTRLRYTRSLPYSLRLYEELLNERAPSVFNECPTEWNVHFWEQDTGQSAFPSRKYDSTSVHDIRGWLLDNNEEDPMCRHMFIEADHSMAPLNCSREMLCLLLTFHQVMPQFLDVLLSFGKFPGHNISAAPQRCIFKYEHMTSLEDAQRRGIPQLGRSGREIRHCFNLWSVEKSEHDKRPWAIRQTGVYHSFDTHRGRATWIHVKANDLLQKRIEEATVFPDDLGKNYLHIIKSTFTASLMTHLIIFEWCNENWRHYLTYWEFELMEVLTRIREAPIIEVEKILQGSNNLSKEMSSPWSGPRRIGSNPVDTSLQTNRRETQPTLPITVYGPHKKESNPFQAFEDFKFNDLQRLSKFGAKLREAEMILKLNADILREITEYYQHYMRDTDAHDIIRDGCRAALSDFVFRANGIKQELQNERTRITTLLSLLEDGKALFDATINFRNMELNRFSSKRIESWTKDMHQSTLQMKTIAEKTEEETASMHTITLVTLIFLPGTFVATFLGAGFYQWPNSDRTSDIPNDPVWRPHFFYLFIEISLSLTVLVLLAWIVPRMYRWLSRRRGKLRERDEEMQAP